MPEKSDTPHDEVKMNENVMKVIERLEKRIIEVELKIDALNTRLESVAMHPEDEGWFQ
jgi:hypothetical protein